MVTTPVLFDTNILIDYLRGIPQARAECDRHADRAVSIISWMEVMAGSTAANEADARSLPAELLYPAPRRRCGRTGIPSAQEQAGSNCPTPSFRRPPKQPAAFSSPAIRAISPQARQGCGFLTLSRAEPELLYPLEFCAGSPLAGGRIDLNSEASGYAYSGFAIAFALRFQPLQHIGIHARGNLPLHRTIETPTLGILPLLICQFWNFAEVDLALGLGSQWPQPVKPASILAVFTARLKSRFDTMPNR